MALIMARLILYAELFSMKTEKIFITVNFEFLVVEVWAFHM